MSNYEVWKSPELVKRYLSGMRSSFPGAMQQFEVMMKLINANGTEIKHLLDLGCGDGILGSMVLDQYPQSQGVFVDLSEDMLLAAKQKMSEMLSRVELIQHDYQDKKWVDRVNHKAPYDVIVSGFSIHHQVDVRKKEIYQEIYHLLKPGGLFINVEHVLSRSPWIEHIHDENFVDALSDYENKVGTRKSRQEVSDKYYSREDSSANILALVEDQCEWLREIGYKDVDCYFKLFELTVFGGRNR